MQQEICGVKRQHLTGKIQVTCRFEALCSGYIIPIILLSHKRQLFQLGRVIYYLARL